MNWILNLIGILIFFINRYYNRAKRTIAFSFKFWLRDNFQELSTTLLLNLAFMILLHMKDAPVENLLAKLPVWVAIMGVPGLSFALGLGASWFIYKLFWKKLKDAKK